LPKPTKQLPRCSVGADLRDATIHFRLHKNPFNSDGQNNSKLAADKLSIMPKMPQSSGNPRNNQPERRRHALVFSLA
jgi:hypothetical protein